jgi:PIN domain nuclease of toxin-antitoxin system
LHPRFLLDTHIVVRWLYEPKRLSREQVRVLNDAGRHGDCVGLSAMSLLELATLNEEKQRLSFRLENVFRELDNNPAFLIMPLTTEIA